jgi:hypothetical protein
LLVAVLLAGVLSACDLAPGGGPSPTQGVPVVAGTRPPASPTIRGDKATLVAVEEQEANASPVPTSAPTLSPGAGGSAGK